MSMSMTELVQALIRDIGGKDRSRMEESLDGQGCTYAVTRVNVNLFDRHFIVEMTPYDRACSRFLLSMNRSS